MVRIFLNTVRIFLKQEVRIFFKHKVRILVPALEIYLWKILEQKFSMTSTKKNFEAQILGEN